MRRISGTLQWCLTPEVLRTLYDAAVRKLPSEDFPEIIALFFQRPQFQVHPHAPPR